MKNVYESVRSFFEEEMIEPSIVSREWVEGFLRQKAWSGSTDAELHDIWKQLQGFVLYLSYTHFQFLDELVAEDFADAINWLSLNASGFKKTLKNVRQFFLTLEAFYQYLIGRKLLEDTAELALAAERIAGGKRLNLSDSRHALIASDEASKTGGAASALSENMGDIPATVEKLMLKIGSYFQRDSFDEEFHRALYLYVGPLQPIPAADDEEFSAFWIGFWDYFLFDYHIRRDDSIPVAYFLRNQPRISSVERILLEDLTAARFTVFYIDRIIDPDWVECVNLFSGEVFRMPHPEFDYRLIKRLLFFGHVFAHGSFVANYVASIEISANLRQRIKQEVLRLKDLFCVQQPAASWDDFLVRHSLAVRHTISLLTSFAKLNVTSVHAADLLSRPTETLREPDSRVKEHLQELMQKYGFSSHDIYLAQSMWHDFCQTDDVKLRKTGGWTAAVMSCYASINTPYALPVEELSIETGASATTIYTNRRRIMDALGIQPHDPRYLSEEGLLLFLYSS